MTESQWHIPAGTRVLVTGATGFTGLTLVRHLAGKGLRVVALVRPQSDVAALDGLSVTVVRGDVCDQDTVARAMEGIAYVFHLAGTFRQSDASEQEHRRVQVGGTQCVARAAAACGTVKRMVHVSTIGVHGHVEHPPADEESPFNPDDDYQRTKVEAEQWLGGFAKTSGLSVVIVRPTAIYGPGDRRFLKMFRMVKNGVFPIVGNGRGLVHFIHVEDLVAFLALTAVHPRASGEVFICGEPSATALRDVLSIIGRAYGVQPRIVRIPAAPMFALADFCEWICGILRIKPPIYRRRVAFYTKDRAFCTEKMTRVLGYRTQITLEDGLTSLAAWYAEHGWVKGAVQRRGRSRRA